MAIEDTLNKGVLKSWGKDIIYTRISDDVETEIKGVFDNAFIEINSVAAVRPIVKIRLADLSQAPAKNDLVEVNSTTYKVKEIQTDGTGNATLILQRSS